MKRCPPLKTLVTLMMAIVLVAGVASAQFQTGNIYGKTTSKEGDLLPGVTVTLTGVGAPLTQVTDAQGNFRFLNLSPGTYQVRAELSGFGSSTRTGVNVNVGANADITMELNPAVTEAITVTAAAPLLDTRKSGTGATVDQIELQSIPTARDPWMIMQSTPGVMVDRINVGGTQSGQQSQYISKGAPRNDGTWNVDGVNITDMGATGSSPTYYDFDMFEELQITTGGSDPRIQTSGVQMNMVTKRGTNDYKGSGRYLYAPGSTSADPTVPSEASGYLSRANSVNYVRDYGVELGGPLWRDRAWLWLARGDQKISTWQSAGVPQPTFFIPDDTVLTNKNAKLNAQFHQSNSFVAAYTFGDKFRNARDLSPTRPFEASWKQTGPTKLYKIEDTQMFGSSLYLTGMWSKVSGGFGLFGNGGTGSEAPSFWVNPSGVFQNNYYTYETVRPQKQYRLDGSKFLGLMGKDHELKFGFGYRDTPVSSASIYPGAAGGFLTYSSNLVGTNVVSAATCAAQGLPANCAVAYLYRPPQANYSGKYTELYLGDTVMFGNLTLQAGLRYDKQESQILPMSISGNAILGNVLNIECVAALNCTGGRRDAVLPGIEFPGQDRALEWKSIAPRIGITYALGSDKKSLVRAGYNRYISQMGSTVSSSSPVGNSYLTFYMMDANGDNVVQRSELAKLRSVTGINLNAPASLTSTRRIDYDMNPPTTDELLVGYERELLSDFSVGVTVTHRRTKDLSAVLFEKTQGAGDFYTAADYELIPGVNAGGSFSANGHTFTTTTLPVYQLKSNLQTPQFSVITNRPDYEQTYNGIELVATKRMSKNWMMRFNGSYNDYSDDCGSDSFANPTPQLNSTGIVNGFAAAGGPPACIGGQVAPQSAGSGAFGNVFINSKWNMNLNGVYVAPLGIHIGANFMTRQGYPAPHRATVTGVRGGNPNVILDPLGEIRFDNVYQLDLRLSREFRFFNRAGITISGEVFNATNERTILQRNTTVLTNAYNSTTGAVTTTPVANGWRITELQAPRVYRIGAKFNF
jgi:Carboxypeptidase regulatory-like domain